MTYPFLEGAEPAFIAHIDQVYAEQSNRVTSAMALAMAAKLLYREGDRQGCKYLADAICESLSNTPPDEVRSMMTLALDNLANAALAEMDDETMAAMVLAARQSVIDLKAMMNDSPDSD